MTSNEVTVGRAGVDGCRRAKNRSRQRQSGGPPARPCIMPGPKARPGKLSCALAFCLGHRRAMWSHRICLNSVAQSSKGGRVPPWVALLKLQGSLLCQ